MALRRVLVLPLLLALVGVLAPASPPAAASVDPQPAYPGIRAAFYYPWFPEAWDQEGVKPFTKYTPTLGWYDSSDPGVIAAHIAAMRHGGVEAGIASWWGRGGLTDPVIPLLLDAAAATPFRWALYHEREGYGDPSVPELTDDLRYIGERYARHPGYLRIGGRPVVFVYNDVGDDCSLARRWKAANVIDAFLVFKLAKGWESCRSLGDAWHQYAPGLAYIEKRGEFVSLSPGFDRVHEPGPRLPRDGSRWYRDVRAMVAAEPKWQLITSFNEWGEGTSVEPAREWESASRFGGYLDALATDGQEIFPVRARLAGGDRYATAAAVAGDRWAPGVPVAFVASGDAFPDALAGGAAAGTRGGPVLLTRRTELPAATEQALARLAPREVVVLGGEAAVSPAVQQRLAAVTGAPVRRLAGPDRYATAAAVAAATFEPGVGTVYVSSGESFADGLVAGSAGAARGAPVLLVGADAVPSVTAHELARLRPSSLTVVGGTAVVSQRVQDELAARTGVPVHRRAGPDRYATAVAVSTAHRVGRVDVFLATGANFPDALAGAAAGRDRALLLVRPECVPDVVYDELKRLDPGTVTALGGTVAVSDRALQLLACRR